MPFTVSNIIIGEPFTQLTDVDSTNNYAMAQARQQLAVHGTVWFAHNQTAAKGQRGKRWHSEAGKNIAMSVLLNMRWLKVDEQFKLSATIALALHDFVNKYAQINLKIKWPNDIYFGDRKAAGILIENILQGNNWQWAVVGIGVNINQTQFDSALKNAVSLKQITNKNFNVIELAKEACGCIQNRYQQLKQQKFEEILKSYNAVLYKRNEEVKLKKNNIIFKCLIDEVNEFGQLTVKNAVKENFDFGKVEWIIND
ncbi:MAG: biotin--[acetyl-CoA-carboxylase] ligase [Chitinophagaceae bacterium]